MITWNVHIYYDYLDDEFCDTTEYKFAEKSIAEDFIIKTRDSFVFLDKNINKIENESRHIVVPKDYKMRPIFTNVEDALQDLEDFTKRNEYSYKYETFRIDLNYMELIMLRCRNDELEKENSLLKSEIQKQKNK